MKDGSGGGALGVGTIPFGAGEERPRRRPCPTGCWRGWSRRRRESLTACQQTPAVTAPSEPRQRRHRAATRVGAGHRASRRGGMAGGNAIRRGVRGEERERWRGQAGTAIILPTVHATAATRCGKRGGHRRPRGEGANLIPVVREVWARSWSGSWSSLWQP